MATNIVHTIKLVAEAAKAVETIRQYQDQIVGVAQTVKKYETTLSGDSLFRNAQNWTAAVAKLGGATNGLASSEQILAGVSKLTATEKERLNRTVTEAITKYRALGETAPTAMRQLEAATRSVETKTTSMMGSLQGLAGMLGLAFGVHQIVNFGRELLRMGDEIVRVHDQTQMSTEEVQRLGFVASQSGNDLEELTGSVSQMQNRLASGDKSAIAAVKDLHLSLGKLRTAGPYQQMQMLAAAFGAIPDPAMRTALAMDLLGKSGAAVLPTLISDFDKLAASAPVMSDAMIRELDDAGDALDRITLRAKVWGAEGLNLIVRSFQTDWEALIQPFINRFDDWRLSTEGHLFSGPGTAGVGLTRGWQAGQTTTTTGGVTLGVFPGTKEAGIVDLVAGFKTLSKVEEEAAKRQDTLYGRDLIARAQQYASDLGNINNLSRISREKQDEINKAMMAAIAVYERVGQTGPAAYRAVAAATAPTLKSTIDLTTAVYGHWQDLGDVTEETTNLMAGLTKDGLLPVSRALFGQEQMLSELPHVASQYGDALEALRAKSKSLAESLRDWVENIPQLIQQGFTGGGGLAGAAKAGLSGLGALVGKGFGEKIVASIGTEFASSMAGKLIPGFMAAAGAIGPSLAASASKIGRTIGSAITGSMLGATIGMMATKGGMVGGIYGAAAGAVVGAIYGVIKATTGPGSFSQAYKDWKAAEVDANQKFADTELKLTQTYGSLAEIDKMGKLLGIDLVAALGVGGAGGPGTAGLENLNRVADEFTKKYNELQTAIKKYSIVFDDLTGPARAREIANTTAQLASETDVLRGYGVTEEKILKRMAPAYEDLLTSALRTGDKLPATLKPMLLEMARLNLLTDATKNKLLGLGDVKVAPTFEEIQAIATKYNMDVERLGKPYAQMEGKATGGQIVADYNKMVAAGMDPGRVAEQMQKQVSAVVEQALKYGTKLPVELAPIIKSLASWGQLIDSEGKAISDISALQYDLGPMVEAMQGQSQAQTDALVAAIDALPWDAAVADPIVNATQNQTKELVAHIDALRTGEMAAYHAGGLVMDSYHAGGMVFARAMLAMPHFSAGGEVPAWVLPGEGVLSRNVGMPAIGGAGALAAANRGERPGGQVNLTINIDRPVLRDRQAITELADEIMKKLPSRLKFSAGI